MRTETSPTYAYIQSCLPPESAEKQRARALSAELGLAAISISPVEATLIQGFVRTLKPQKIVEIGTLTGLSCLYFLEALQPDGCIWTLEKSAEHIQKAEIVLQPYIDSGRCRIVAGDARESLPALSDQGPFDVIFIDGNKAAYYDYWKWAELNIKTQGAIIIDNVFLAGSVWGDQEKQKFSDKQIDTVKKMSHEIINSKNFSSFFIPTAEGLLIATKK